AGTSPTPSPTDAPSPHGSSSPDAPSPDRSTSPSASKSEDAGDGADGEDGNGPDASGTAAKGLCQSYRSGGSPDSTARHALVQAAGGEDKLDEYCDGVLAERDAKHSPRSSNASGAPTTGHDSGKS